MKSSSLGVHESPLRGRGLEFDAVREYVLGDDIRSIDWKVTARTGRAHLKLFNKEKQRQVLICLDMNAYMRFGTKVTFKSVLAAQVLAMIGWQALSANDNVGACLFGDVEEGLQYFSPKKGSTSFCRILKAVSEKPIINPQVSIDHALKKLYQISESGALIYLISDFLDIEEGFDESLLKKLCRKCEVVFISINDPFDQQICPVGQLCFEEGSKSFFLDTSDKKKQEAYLLAWQKNRENLASLTRKLRINTLALSTASDGLKSLALKLKHLVARRAT